MRDGFQFEVELGDPRMRLMVGEPMQLFEVREYVFPRKTQAEGLEEVCGLKNAPILYDFDFHRSVVIFTFGNVPQIARCGLAEWLWAQLFADHLGDFKDPQRVVHLGGRRAQKLECRNDEEKEAGRLIDPELGMSRRVTLRAGPTLLPCCHSMPASPPNPTSRWPPPLLYFDESRRLATETDAGAKEMTRNGRTPKLRSSCPHDDVEGEADEGGDVFKHPTRVERCVSIRLRSQPGGRPAPSEYRSARSTATARSNCLRDLVQPDASRPKGGLQPTTPSAREGFRLTCASRALHGVAPHIHGTTGEALSAVGVRVAFKGVLVVGTGGGGTVAAAAPPPSSLRHTPHCATGSSAGLPEPTRCKTDPPLTAPPASSSASADTGDGRWREGGGVVSRMWM
ncbi:hypothetical protein DFH09DRAFT_1427877 [Mycena vulgaris]|nr:hypothetical protein DFH09DRAFT_1427877 [Mycena vulgaris]